MCTCCVVWDVHGALLEAFCGGLSSVALYTNIACVARRSEACGL